MPLLDDLIVFTKSLLGTTATGTFRRHWPTVRKVREREAHLQGLDDQHLRDLSSQLREQVRTRGGFTRESTREALALVREVADRRVGMWQALTAADGMPKEAWGDAWPGVEQTRRRLQNGEAPWTIDLPAIVYERIRAAHPQSVPPCRMRGHDVQIFGALVLLEGKVAEMRTGEGKTLVASFAAYLSSLAGQQVHIVTVNDYLASRDAQWNAPTLRFLGTTVGAIQNQMDPRQRKEVYANDVVYGTNSEFGFDYLRDNLAHSVDEQVQGRRCFAIIDEVDSILIDEARVPLIISGPGTDRSAWYRQADAVAASLVKGRDFTIDPKDRSVSLTEAGVDRAARTFGVPSLYDGDAMHLPHLLDNALKARHLFLRDHEYLVQDGQVRIIDEHTGRVLDGRRWSDGLHQAVEAKEGVALQAENQTHATITLQNYFRLYERLAGMTGTAMTEAQELDAIYGLEVVPVPPDRPAIRRDLPDRVFWTRDDKVAAILDDVAAIHAIGQPVLIGTASVEASEHLSDAFIRRGIPHQVLNARQHQREAEIVRRAGQFGAVTIATNMAGRGTDIMCGKASAEEAFRHWIAHGLMPKGMPDELSDAGFDDLILERWATRWPSELLPLNASGDARLLAINRQRDRHGLPPLPRPSTLRHGVDVRRLGGLFIIGSERHESRRIDNQLCGRSGRQGDPGTTCFYLSREDDLLKRFASEYLAGVNGDRKRTAMPDRMIQAITRQFAKAQRRAEEFYAGVRKNLLGYDQVANAQRLQIYGQRQAILRGDEVTPIIHRFFRQSLDALIQAAASDGCRGSELAHRIAGDFAKEYGLPTPDSTLIPVLKDGNACLGHLFPIIERALADRQQDLGASYPQAMQFVLLRALDGRWMEHLGEMDHLRHAIGLEGYAQKDPHMRYKEEGYRMFAQMNEGVCTDVTRTMLRIRSR